MIETLPVCVRRKGKAPWQNIIHCVEAYVAALRSVRQYRLNPDQCCNPHEGPRVEFGPTVTVESGSCDVQYAAGDR